jgi:polar amino acid transport system substrate-binding protein
MKPNHPSLRLLPLLLLSLVLAAPAAIAEDGLAAILARKTLRIGVADFAPWTFTNRAGQLEGFEIDLGRQLANDLGVAAEFKLASLENLYQAADRGEIDLIAAGLAITPARALRVDFSAPYYESGTTLVTNRQLAAGTKRPEDLNREGVTVVVVADTFSASLAAQLFDVAQIKYFPDRRGAEDELLGGRAQGYLTSVPDARILALRHPAVVELPLAAPLVRSVSGLAVKRGNQALLNYLNAWITAHWADNLLPTLNSYWFSSYEWVGHLQEPPAKP